MFFSNTLTLGMCHKLCDSFSSRLWKLTKLYWMFMSWLCTQLGWTNVVKYVVFLFNPALMLWVYCLYMNTIGPHNGVQSGKIYYWRRLPKRVFNEAPSLSWSCQIIDDVTESNTGLLICSQEVAHRQQFYFWKHHRNNRLKHILPRPLPEEPAPPAPPPPVVQPTPPPPVPVKAEGTTRAGAGERRKRKYTN